MDRDGREFRDGGNGQRAFDAGEVVVEEGANNEVLVELAVVANLNRAETARTTDAAQLSEGAKAVFF